MSKLNKKGFMLAEVVVVSVVIATTLVTLYIGLNKVSSAYETRDRYHDIDALYYAIAVNDSLVENNMLSTLGEEEEGEQRLDNKSIAVIDNIGDIYTNKNYLNYNCVKSFYVPYTETEFTALKNQITKVGYKYKETFKDYISYLEQNEDVSNNSDGYAYMIVVEVCKKDKDDCYYYALKVKDGDADE